MRVGLLVSGLILLLIGFWFTFLFGFGLFLLGFPLVIIGLGLLIAGAASRGPARAGVVSEEMIRSVIARVYQSEIRHFAVEPRLRAIEERLGLVTPPEPQVLPPAPALTGPVPGPAFPPVAPPAALEPAPSSPTPPISMPLPPTSAATSPAGKRPLLGGISRFEFELGEKWLQRVAIVILSIAFVFLLSIVLPTLSPSTIVAIDFATGLGLALVGEFLFSRKSLHVYGKGLEAGAFVLAYIGVWGGGFYFALPAFPTIPILIAILVLHSAAALRYRSPLLTVEVGAFYLVWIVGLRSLGYLAPFDLAILLSGGAFGVLALAYARKDETSVLILAFGFDAVALGVASLLVPWGYLPVLATGLATVGVLSFLRVGKVLSVSPETRVGIWATGVILVYGVMLANGFVIRGQPFGDLTILGTYASLTAALATAEIFFGEERLRSWFVALVGVLSFPVPFLMLRGELALAVFPALLLTLALLRPSKGLAWFPNFTYLGIIAFASFAVALPDPVPRFATMWGIFFATTAVHAVLQRRSDYAPAPRNSPADLQLIVFVAALSGFTVEAVPDAANLPLYASAIIVALLLNRSSLRGAGWQIASVIAILAGAFTLARAWALAPIVTGPDEGNAPYLAAFHVVIFLGLAGWLATRKPATSTYEFGPGKSVRFSWPALALLLGLMAQDLGTASFFAILPPVVVVLAFVLADGIAFNIGWAALMAQTTLAVSLFMNPPTQALILLPILAAVQMGLGFALEWIPDRKPVGLATQTASALAWLVVMPLVAGVTVGTTIAWAVVGGVTVAWGLWRRFALLRYFGFSLMFAALGKVFLYDIAGLTIELRIVGLIVVALVLFTISYGYARYRKRHVAPA